MQHYMNELQRYLIRGWSVVICAALIWGALFVGFAWLLPTMLWLIAGIGWALLPIAVFMVYALSLGTYTWLVGSGIYWLFYRQRQRETDGRKSIAEKYAGDAVYESKQAYLDDFLADLDDADREYIRQKLAGERLRLSDDGELVRADALLTDAPPDAAAKETQTS